MNVGIPGTGVGGLFYLAASVLLPVRALGRPGDRRSAIRAGLRQATLAVAMFAGMWATGWLLGLLVGPAVVLRGSFAQRIAAAEHNNLIQWALVSLGYLVLGTLLTAVEIARIVVRRRPSGRRPSGEHRSPVAAMR